MGMLALAAGSVGSNFIQAPITTPAPIIEKLTDEEYIRMRFSHRPVLVEVSRCESQFRQNDKDGKTLRGRVNQSDLGLMQVNEYYHGEQASDLGFDLYTREGNTSYAEYLFDKEGLRPWNSSKPCWGKTAAYNEYKTELAK